MFFVHLATFFEAFSGVGLGNDDGADMIDIYAEWAFNNLQNDYD